MSRRTVLPGTVALTLLMISTTVWGVPIPMTSYGTSGQTTIARGNLSGTGLGTFIRW